MDELCKAQEVDPSLNKIRDLAKSGEVKVTRCGGTSKFLCRDGILYRGFQSLMVNFGEVVSQVVVPQPYHVQVIKLARSCSHVDINKTTLKVLSHFLWPVALFTNLT